MQQGVMETPLYNGFMLKNTLAHKQRQVSVFCINRTMHPLPFDAHMTQVVCVNGLKCVASDKTDHHVSL